MTRRLIDLTRSAAPAPGASPWATPAGMQGDAAATAAWCAAHGIDPDHLPRAPGFVIDAVRGATRHWGTRIDAPAHSVAGAPPARTLDGFGLGELVREALVLDLRDAARPDEAISIDALEAAIDAAGRDIRAGDAVLLRTGQDRWPPGDPRPGRHPGMTREGTLFLTLRGAAVLGTDALCWDRPFEVLARLYHETGDPALLWDAHLAIAERPALIVSGLCNLGALPPSGFELGLFPLKLTGATTSPCRAVAFINT